jgi:hypothetical protein
VLLSCFIVLLSILPSYQLSFIVYLSGLETASITTHITHDVLPSRRTFFSMPMPILQACYRSMLCIRPAWTYGSREDSARRLCLQHPQPSSIGSYLQHWRTARFRIRKRHIRTSIAEIKPNHVFTHLPLLSASEFGLIHTDGVYGISEGRNVLSTGHSTRC